MTNATARQIENMKNQTIGVEVEMNNITRRKAAKIAATYFGTGDWSHTAHRNGYETWSAWDADGREWKFQKDVSIAGPDSQKCELVTPVLTYDDMELLQGLVRALRRAGAKSSPSRGCGVHIHIGSEGHTPQTIRNLVNLMASHEDQLSKAIEISYGRRRYCQTVDHDFLQRIYHAYTDETPGENNRDIYLRREEVFHVPGLGFNGLVGFSPIAMMKNALGTTLAVEKYGSSFFRNGAQPSGVLEHPGVLKNPEKIRQNWSDVYGGANNAHKVAVLEEAMHYKPISLPPEDSQFLSTRQFGVNEICRIFRVPPHMVQDLEHATYSNIEYESINFVVHTLTPWLVRFEQAIVKDLLLEEEQDVYFPKFNVDGLLRGDYQSRMQGYATGISNGFLSPNDVHRLENMDLIPAEKGGDNYYLNGGYVKLSDAGKEPAEQTQKSPPDTPEESEQDTSEEKPENRKRGKR